MRGRPRSGQLDELRDTAGRFLDAARKTSPAESIPTSLVDVHIGMDGDLPKWLRRKASELEGRRHEKRRAAIRGFADRADDLGRGWLDADESARKAMLDRAIEAATTVMRPTR